MFLWVKISRKSLFIPLGCLQLKCLPCRSMCKLLCGSTLLSCLSPYQHTASVSQIHANLYYVLLFCTCTCCVHRGGKAGLADPATTWPVFWLPSLCLQARCTLIICTYSCPHTLHDPDVKEDCGDLKTNRFWAWWQLWHSWPALLGIQSRLIWSKTLTTLRAPLLHMVPCVDNCWCRWTMISMRADVKRIRILFLCQT